MARNGWTRWFLNISSSPSIAFYDSLIFMDLPLCTSEKSVAYSSLPQHITSSCIAIKCLPRLSIFGLDKPRSPTLSLHTMSSRLQTLWWSSGGLTPSLWTTVCLVLWSSKLDTAALYSQVLFCKASVQLDGPLPIWMQGVLPPLQKDLAFAFDHLHEVPISSIFQPAKILQELISLMLSRNLLRIYSFS